MSPFTLDLEKTQTENALVAVEPALNAFSSMLLISKSGDDPGISDPGVHEWVARTSAQMSVEERFRHKLVTSGFYYAILPRSNAMTFDVYLESLEATPPSEFRDRLLSQYEEICMTDRSKKNKGEIVNWEEVLSSAENYVAFLRYRFGEDKTEIQIETRAYQYVIDPVALKQLVTGHIRWFWRSYLQAEWARVRPMLEESARAFNKLDLRAMTRAELLRFVTGKVNQEAKWIHHLEESRGVIFVPNAHIGPYIHTMKIGDTSYIYFGAHLPEGSDVRVPELDRAEIVSKLSALADETRLQILQMIAESGEMRANEIMDAVKLSQPSVSRYLAQLTASGYLQERRVNGAKSYTLNRVRIEKTLKAVSAFLLDRSKGDLR
jgi:DNA-binding transcriptional ArsR family regulator